VFGVFALLYLLSHKNEKMTNMGVRLLMAIRGKHNPLQHEAPIEKAMVKNLEEHQDSQYHQEWFIRSVLAKQGTTSPATKEDTPGVKPMDGDH